MELMINPTSHKIDDAKELPVQLARIHGLPFAEVWLRPVAS
jgi:hypothetical protein